MGRYLVSRIVAAVPVMLLVSTSVFLLLFLTPGDPVATILGGEANPGRGHGPDIPLGAGVSMPTFWVGLNLIFLFAVVLNWLPVAGYAPLTSGPGETLRYLLLPAVTLAFPQAALLARMTRSVMLDTLREDYVRTARSKGL